MRGKNDNFESETYEQCKKRYMNYKAWVANQETLQAALVAEKALIKLKMPAN